MSAIIAQEMIVVGTAFNQHTCRITRMHFAGILADPIAQVIVRHVIVARRPEFQTGVRCVRKVVSIDSILLAVDQHAGVPDSICPIVANHRLGDSLQQHAAAPSILSPAELGVMKVVGEVTVFNGPVTTVAYHESRLPAFGPHVLERDVGNILRQDGRLFEFTRFAFARADQPGSTPIDGNVRCADFESTVRSLGIQLCVFGNHQDVSAWSIGLRGIDWAARRLSNNIPSRPI